MGRRSTEAPVPFTLSERSRGKLRAVHPDLVAVLEAAAEISDIAFEVTEGVRSFGRQRELYIAGASRTLHSQHLVQLDGYAHAVDVMAVGDLDGDGDVDAADRARTWDRELYTRIAEAVLASATRLGVPVRWGGTFRGFFDGPHFELVG